MKRIFGLVIVTSLALMCGMSGCKKKPDAGGGSGSGSDPGSGSAAVVAVDPNAKHCGTGMLVKAGACVPMVTAEQVVAVDVQKTKLDDLAKLLDKADDIAAPIELLDAVRKLDEWKTIAATNDKFKIVEDVIAFLGEVVKQLHVLQADVKNGSVHLNNISVELAKIMAETGATEKLEDVQARLGKELQGTVDGLSKQVVTTIEKVRGPIKAQLADVSDLLITACTLAKVSGGSDKLKELCGKARDIFAKATVFLADMETKPQELINELAVKLGTQLQQLLSVESKTALETAQQAINDALKLPAAGSGSGSGVKP